VTYIVKIPLLEEPVLSLSKEVRGGFIRSTERRIICQPMNINVKHAGIILKNFNV
jgi:hypothetical protein